MCLCCGELTFAVKQTDCWIMVLTGVCSFIPLYKLYQRWLELLNPYSLVQVGHTLRGWRRRSWFWSLLLCLALQAKPVSMQTLWKCARTGFAAPSPLTIRDPSTPSPDSASAFQLWIHMLVAAEHWQICKMLYPIAGRCTSRYNLLTSGLLNHSVFLVLPAASLLNNIRQRTELVNLCLQEL